MFAYCSNGPVNRSDPSGNLWEIAVVMVVCAIILTGCSGSKVGSAPDYVEIPESDGNRSKNPNCYSYAAGYYDQSYDPGDLSRTSFSMDVDSVAQAVISDMTAVGRTARIIDNHNSPISETEYRIALRTSEVYLIPTQNGVRTMWDYHFMVQTSDGNWAEKHGPGGATVYHSSGNPNTISWDWGDWTGFYTSEIIYIAISRNGA